MLAVLAACATLMFAAPPAEERRLALPDDPEIRDLVEQSLAAEDAGELERAIALHQEIVRRRPSEVRSLTAIAGLYGAMDDFASEVTWAERAIAVDPRHAPAYANLGIALHRLGRDEEALRAFEKAGALGSPLGPYSLGVLADEADDFEAAVGFYRKAIALDPRFAPGYFNLGAALANLRRFDEAVRALERAIEIDPGHDEARDMLERVRRAAARAKAPRK